jgi:phosphatidate cytidylyltransferase
MTFNFATFKTRALTSVVFVLVMLAGLLWNACSFIILFTIIHFGCWYEFVKLMMKIKPVTYKYFLPAGLLYITLPILLMIDLRLFFFKKDIIPGNFLLVIPCGIIFSIWINDTMAYIVGSLIGKTPLSIVSPKKTWEGTIGGAILCITAIAAIAWKSKLFTIKDGVMIAAMCAVFGTLGDLLQSKLKRMAKVKDSGSLMPGHGGFLDRFDSLLLTTPFVWLYVYSFM